MAPEPQVTMARLRTARRSRRAASVTARTATANCSADKPATSAGGRRRPDSESTISGESAAGQRDDRRPAGHRLGGDHAERFVPHRRHQRERTVPDPIGQFHPTQVADIPNSIIQSRGDHRGKVRLVDDRTGDAQLESGGLRRSRSPGAAPFPVRSVRTRRRRRRRGRVARLGCPLRCGPPADGSVAATAGRSPG